METIYNHTNPVTCNEGNDIEGDDHITCLVRSDWSSYTHCAIKCK